jgi:hypothetical protein
MMHNYIADDIITYILSYHNNATILVHHMSLVNKQWRYVHVHDYHLSTKYIIHCIQFFKDCGVTTLMFNNSSQANMSLSKLHCVITEIHIGERFDEEDLANIAFDPSVCGLLSLQVLNCCKDSIHTYLMKLWIPFMPNLTSLDAVFLRSNAWDALSWNTLLLGCKNLKRIVTCASLPEYLVIAMFENTTIGTC